MMRLGRVDVPQRELGAAVEIFRNRSHRLLMLKDAVTIAANNSNEGK